HVVMAHEADRTECERMVVGHDALTVERCRHGNEERLGESTDRLGRTAARSAVAGQHDRITCGAQNLCGTLQLGDRWIGGPRDVDGQRVESLRSGGVLDILRYCEIDRSGSLGLRELEGLPDHFRHGLWSRYKCGPLRRRCEHRDQVDALMRLL